MNHTTDRGTRIEVRTAVPDPRVPVPAGGRLLGFAHQLDDDHWRVATVDGRTTVLDTRVAAVLGLLAMCDATDATEPSSVEELQAVADRLAVELGAVVTRLAEARGSDQYDRPADAGKKMIKENGGAGRHGARFAAVTDDGIVPDDPAAGR